MRHGNALKSDQFGDRRERQMSLILKEDFGSSGELSLAIQYRQPYRHAGHEKGLGLEASPSALTGLHLPQRESGQWVCLGV